MNAEWQYQFFSITLPLQSRLWNIANRRDRRVPLHLWSRMSTLGGVFHYFNFSQSMFLLFVTTVYFCCCFWRFLSFNKRRVPFFFTQIVIQEENKRHTVPDEHTTENEKGNNHRKLLRKTGCRWKHFLKCLVLRSPLF